MGGIRWNLDKWATGFVELERGRTIATGIPEMTRVVLPMAPLRNVASMENPADIVRQLVGDPAYQLK